MTQVKKTFWLSLFGLLIILVPGLLLQLRIHGMEHVIERAYLEDSTRVLSFADIQKKIPIPYEGILGKGFSSSHHWIRLTLRRAATTEDLILRIRPQYLDEIQLYTPEDPSHTPRISGDRVAWNDAEFRSLNHTFSVHLSEPVQIVWLRVSSTSTILMDINAFTPSNLRHIERSSEFFSNVYIGIMLCALLFAVFVAMGQCEPVAWVFVALQLSSICLALSMLGHLRLWFARAATPEALGMLGEHIALTNAVVSLIFYAVLLKLHDAPRWGVRIITVVIAAYPVLFGLLWLDQTRIAINVNVLVLLVSPPTLLLTAFGVRPGIPRDGESRFLSRSSLMIFFGLLTVALSLSSLPMLGVMPAREISLHNLLLPTVINDLMMLSLLFRRSQDKARAELSKAENMKLVEYELAFQTRKTQEQSRFMTMLTHELKTPLSIVRIAMSARHQSPDLQVRAQHAILDMNAVIDRCIQMMQVEAGASSVELVELDLLQLLTELKDGSEQPTRVHIDGASHLDFRSDPGLCSIIFRNFISNALKYGAPDEAVVIAIAQQSRDNQMGVLIEFRNHVGPVGMPDPKRVFEKFYRGVGAHRTIGAGLGLFLARGLARELGGDVTFNPGIGVVRFDLWLPGNAAG
ncbi:MAG: histidine kinase [Hyphomicrobiales bacterium]|nr:histidine kinase [Hyphomicrobiales bacterium]